MQSTDETLLEGKNVLKGKPGKISQLIRKAPSSLRQKLQVGGQNVTFYPQPSPSLKLQTLASGPNRLRDLLNPYQQRGQGLPNHALLGCLLPGWHRRRVFRGGCGF